MLYIRKEAELQACGLSHFIFFHLKSVQILTTCSHHTQHLWWIQMHNGEVTLVLLVNSQDLTAVFLNKLKRLCYGHSKKGHTSILSIVMLANLNQFCVHYCDHYNKGNTTNIFTTWIVNFNSLENIYHVWLFNRNFCSQGMWIFIIANDTIH